MKYCKFNTELQATDGQNHDFDSYIDSLPTERIVDGETIAIDNSAYLAITERWSNVRQRTTNTDWVYPACECLDNSSRTIIEIDEATEWPSEEEE